MAITASLVKELREKTGAGMIDCKKALVASNGDIEAAIDSLRKKGLATAAKKAGRVAAEGLTAISVNGNQAVAIEVNSETDFVSKNANFQELVSNISKTAIGHKDVESLKSAKMPSGKTVEEEIIESVATIGENISLRRIHSLSVDNGVIASYVHNKSSEGMGKISVLVALEVEGTQSSENQEKIAALGKQIAMHIAATSPQSLNRDGISSEAIERERAIFADQSRASGKPENIIEKMVEGRIRKFFEEVVLLEQTFVIDNKSKISEVIENLSKKLGAKINLAEFVRLELGEGIEKETTSFADEVAAAVKG